MAVCLIMQFGVLSVDKYDDVMRTLDLDRTGWPDGQISHSAGVSPEGLFIVDLWRSREAFERFLETRLKPVFAKVGGIPQPRVTMFPLHNHRAP
jgi:hypothetical protein